MTERLKLLVVVLIVTTLERSLALSSPPSCTASLSSPWVTSRDIKTIAGGGVVVIPGFLSADLLQRMRADALDLFQGGYFVPDGLTNTALKKAEQGFSGKADRQTFRGGDGWLDPKAGDVKTRKEFGSLMARLRTDLAVQLDRPSLAPVGVKKHEMTYNWYEPGASLGRHLDEHHEETKGSKGWLLPTRRSVTWLVYLNDRWSTTEGGSLRTFPRQKLARIPVGAHSKNLQVGWLDEFHPVFLDAFRSSGGSALYTLEDDGRAQETKQTFISAHDFDVPRQPIEFEKFLSSKYQRGRFEQISTARLDHRFVNKDNGGSATTISFAGVVRNEQSKQVEHHMDILPAGGTLVLFDSVSLPHSVNAVTGSRQRLAATGWFHEDNQELPVACHN